MEYNFEEIEEKWQKHWEEKDSFKADPKTDKKKYYRINNLYHFVFLRFFHTWECRIIFKSFRVFNRYWRNTWGNLSKLQYEED